MRKLLEWTSKKLNFRVSIRIEIERCTVCKTGSPGDVPEKAQYTTRALLDSRPSSR